MSQKRDRVVSSADADTAGGKTLDQIHDGNPNSEIPEPLHTLTIKDIHTLLGKVYEEPQYNHLWGTEPNTPLANEEERGAILSKLS